MQPECGTHRLRQFGHRVLDLAQGFPRGRGDLGGPHPGIGGIGGGLEIHEQAPLEAASPDPVEGEVAHHPPDIGGLGAVMDSRRVGDEPEQHILDDILGLGRAIEDAARAGEMGGTLALEGRQDALDRRGRRFGARDRAVAPRAESPADGTPPRRSPEPTGHARRGLRIVDRRVAIPF